MVKQQSVLYRVKLPNGIQEKKLSLLGRVLTLKNGDLYSGIVPNTFPEFFEKNDGELLIDDSSDVNSSVTDSSDVNSSVTDSSDVNSSVTHKKPGRPKKENSNE